MITATIGTDEYQMESLEDAEALLRIMSRSKRLRTHYINRKMYYTADKGAKIKLAIEETLLVTDEEVETLYEQERAKEQAKQEGDQ